VLSDNADTLHVFLRALIIGAGLGLGWALGQAAWRIVAGSAGAAGARWKRGP
jgi:hypothetical protein